MKYIIEIEDEPFEHGSKKLYRTSGFNSLVFDAEGLRRLKPYDESEAEMRGAEKAWEMAYKLYAPFGEGGMSNDELRECFNSASLTKITKMPYQEVAEKYEAWTKKHDEIRVGDEVGSKVFNITGVVTSLSEDRLIVISRSGTTNNWHINTVKKTGRHFPEVEDFMRKLRE